MPMENNTPLELNKTPFSIEAEQSVIGSILIDPQCMNLVANLIKADQFYLSQHKIIFSALLSMYDMNQPIDFLTLYEKLKNDGTDEKAGGKTYLTQLVQAVPSAANVDMYCGIVKDRYYARSLLTVAQKIIEEVNNGNKADELIDSAEQEIYNITQGRESGDLVHISKVISQETFDRLQKIADPVTRSDYIGINCGISELDEALTGFNKSNLIILGARPGVGKTSFALNIARNIAVNENKSVAFFSLEMTRDELAQRLLSNEAGIPSDHLRDSSKMTDKEWIRLSQASETLSKAKLYVDETANITVPQIKAKIRRQKNIDIVIIDYLGLIKGSVRSENRVQEVSEISRSLKIMAKDLNIPLLVCAQLNRGVEGKGGAKHRPGLADLRDSGSIEQDADVVMFLHKDKDKTDEFGEPDNTVELNVEKNRHGPTPKIKLVWDGQFTRFTAKDFTHEEF